MKHCKHSSAFMSNILRTLIASLAIVVLCLCGHMHATPVANVEKPTDHNLEIDALAELLGIPIHQDVGPKRQKMPEFLQSVYDCWSSGSTDCMPEGITDANVVRSFLGFENPSVPRAFQSYNHETELLNSFTISFNTTYKMRQPEAIKYALLRIHRRALSNKEIVGLSEKCDFSHLELRLYTTLGSNDKGNHIVVLKQSMDLNLTAEQLAEPQWFSFNNFTDMYITDIENPDSNKQQLVTVRLSIAETDACPGVSPSLLGFTSKSGTESELVGFSKDTVQSSRLTTTAIKSLSMMYKRKRRQAEVSMAGESGVPDTTDVKFDNHTNITTSIPEEEKTLNEMKNDRCQLYTHTVSFADLGWEEYVVLPYSYQANFCAGSCSWPLEKIDNTTKHSFIQGVANFDNPDLIPPPCCVPSNLEALQVTIQQSENVFVVKSWEDMVATACGCR